MKIAHSSNIRQNQMCAPMPYLSIARTAARRRLAPNFWRS